LEARQDMAAFQLAAFDYIPLPLRVDAVDLKNRLWTDARLLAQA